MLIFVWLGIAAAMAIVEACTLNLVTLWFVVGALAAFVGALCGVGPIAQLVLFLAVSLVTLAAFRPWALRRCATPQAAEPTMEGRDAIVCEPIPAQVGTGRVQTSDAMTWMASSADGEELPVGTPVVVVAQESVRLIVERKRS